VNNTMPVNTHFIGRSLSVWATLTLAPARAAARPLFTPDTMEPRSVINAQSPPTSIAPTPR
jgi:hypothetical protein